jgi:probable rRNA maturation factor
MTLDIRNATRQSLPRLPFSKIAENVLGKNYDLSLVFIGSKLSREMHRKFHKKDSPGNVISFPLSKTSGEIFIDLSEARREASLFKRSYIEHVGALFIHGLYHLKGLRHGRTMEDVEQKARKRFLKAS